MYSNVERNENLNDVGTDFPFSRICSLQESTILIVSSVDPMGTPFETGQSFARNLYRGTGPAAVIISADEGVHRFVCWLHRRIAVVPSETVTSVVTDHHIRKA